MSYESFLPSKKAKAKISGVMIRPPKEQCLFLEELANQHGVSVNQLCVAILREFAEQHKWNQATNLWERVRDND